MYVCNAIPINANERDVEKTIKLLVKSRVYAVEGSPILAYIYISKYFKHLTHIYDLYVLL